MSNQFIHIKEALIAGGLSTGGYQRYDCSVKALAVVKNIPYSQAVVYAKDNFNRLDNKGSQLVNIKSAFTLDSQFVALDNKEVQTQYKVNGQEVIRRMTVGTFAKTYTSGKFYVVVRGHALAIVDGVIIDNNEGLRRPIDVAWRAIED